MYLINEYWQRQLPATTLSCVPAITFLCPRHYFPVSPPLLSRVPATTFLCPRHYFPVSPPLLSRVPATTIPCPRHYFPGIRYYFTTESTGHVPRDIYGNPTTTAPMSPSISPSMSPSVVGFAPVANASFQPPVGSPASAFSASRRYPSTPTAPMTLNSSGIGAPVTPMTSGDLSPDDDEALARRRHLLLEQSMSYSPCSLYHQ